MPDHVHVIVALGATAPWQKPLGRIIGAVKSRSTRCITVLWGTTGRRVWQRGFHDRVVRDAAELERYRRYIAENPARWATTHRDPNV
jgi:putative transposase